MCKAYLQNKKRSSKLKLQKRKQMGKEGAVLKKTPREIRLKYGFYQKYVADGIKMGVSSYCSKENGKRQFTLNDVLKLVDFYKKKGIKISVEQLKI